MTYMSLFVDLTDTATQRNPAPTYVISASVLKTPLATVLRPVAPLRQASRDGELAAFRYAGLLGGVLLFSLSLSPFQ